MKKFFVIGFVVLLSVITVTAKDDFASSLKSCSPFSDSGVVSSVYSICENVEVVYGDENICVKALCDAKSAGQLKKYIDDYDLLFGKEEI